MPSKPIRRVSLSHSLRAILLMPVARLQESGFRNVAHLARETAKLPNTKYHNVKSIEALLSQVFKYRRPLPFDLRSDILRVIEMRVGNTIFSSIKDQLERAINEHNAAVSRQYGDYSASEARLKLCKAAYGFDSVQHYGFLSSYGLERNSETISSLLLYQLAALIADVTIQADGRILWRKLTNITNETISQRNKSELQFIYLVDSQKCAVSLWNKVFSTLSTSLSIWDIPSVIRKNEIYNRLRVYVLKEPLNAICGASLVAFKSMEGHAHVFSLVCDTITEYSYEESTSWRSLVVLAMAQLLKDARLYPWDEAASLTLALSKML